MIRINNKKGFLLLEKSVLELILTIIGILLILVVVVYLFGLVSTAQVKRNAQTSLDILESRANSLEDGQKIMAKLPGLCKEGNDKTCDWFIAGWNKDDLKIPEKYLLKNVICVCNGKMDDLVNACNVQGLCREVKSAKIEIALNSFEVKVDAMNKKEGKTTELIKLPIIAFQSNLIEVEISKNNGVVSFKKIG
ncbi:MAG: hypothetical protein AABW82_03910 [Nanoarchaeota archaeon]